MDCIRFVFIFLILSMSIGSSSSMSMSSSSMSMSSEDMVKIDWADIWRYGGPYGVYCGIFHSSRLFEQPISAVDRACQLHDTCISAAGRYLSCECNEQLSRRMSDVCPINVTDAYYRDQIIRAMNIGTSMCGSASCNLMNRYDVSAEVGYNAIPFYGPIVVNIQEATELLVGIIPTKNVTDFGKLNLIGKPPLADFKKNANGLFKVDYDETLIVFNPHNMSLIFFGNEI